MIKRIWRRIREFFRAAPPRRESIGAGRMLRLMEQRLDEIGGREIRFHERGHRN